MTNRLPVFLFLFFLLSVFPHEVRANFLGAFWLGIDANVETDIKVDQRVLDTINNLPVEIRKQIVIAGNALIESLDEKFKSNINLISKKLLAISLQAAIDWECTGKNVIDKLFNDIKGFFPRILWLSDSCEKKFLPTKMRPGPEEKVNIAECWTYDKIDTDTSPGIVAMKLSDLELMSSDAACRLRETKASKGMWEKKANFGIKYSMWKSLDGKCKNASDCQKVRFQQITQLIQSSDERDIANAREYLNSGAKRVTRRNGCDLGCYEESLLDFHYAESTVKRNKSIRTNAAANLIKEAAENSDRGKNHALKAKEDAKNITTMSSYNNNLKLAKEYVNKAKKKNSEGISLDSSIKQKYKKVQNNISSTEKILSEASVIADTTQDQEAKRVAAEKRNKNNARLLQKNLDDNWMHTK